MKPEDLKLCISSVFLRALLNEIDDVETKQLKQVIKKLDKHLRKVITTRYVHMSPEEATVSLLATKAWEEAKGRINALPRNEMYVSFVIYSIYNEYLELYRLHTVVREKLFKELYNEQRAGMTLALKKSSDEVAKQCVQAINKIVYDYGKETKR